MDPPLPQTPSASPPVLTAPAFGHHRGACPEAGVLGKRVRSGASLPRGRRSSGFERLRARHGPCSFRRTRWPQAGDRGGRSHTVDTTMVSPLRRDGSAKPAADDGAVLEVARLRKLPTQSSQGKVAALVWWFSPLKLVGGGTARRHSSSHWREHGLRRCLWFCKVGLSPLGCEGGAPARAFSLSLLDSRPIGGRGCRPFCPRGLEGGAFLLTTSVVFFS